MFTPASTAAPVVLERRYGMNTLVNIVVSPAFGRCIRRAISLELPVRSAKPSSVQSRGRDGIEHDQSTFLEQDHVASPERIVSEASKVCHVVSAVRVASRGGVGDHVVHLRVERVRGRAK